MSTSTSLKAKLGCGIDRAARNGRIDSRRPLHGLAEARMRETYFEMLHAHGPTRRRTAASIGRARRSSANDNPHQEADTLLQQAVLMAQGDILLEQLPDAPEAPAPEDAQEAVIAHGELSGHRHVARGRVRLVHRPEEARDIPAGLYVGHLSVKSPQTLLEHDQHGPIALSPGIYRVRRQRRLDASDALAVTD